MLICFMGLLAPSPRTSFDESNFDRSKGAQARRDVLSLWILCERAPLYSGKQEQNVRFHCPDQISRLLQQNHKGCLQVDRPRWSLGSAEAGDTMSWIEITEAEYLEVLSDAGATAWPRIPFRRTYDPEGRPPLLPPYLWSLLRRQRADDQRGISSPAD